MSVYVKLCYDLYGDNMELLDVLDENGNKTGEVEDRAEIYRKGFLESRAVSFFNHEKNIKEKKPKRFLFGR